MTDWAVAYFMALNPEYPPYGLASVILDHIRYRKLPLVQGDFQLLREGVLVTRVGI